jgi:CubicO group peptidase (beta-lactamase class C family)
MLFSATKPLTAMCVHLLAERGQLKLDAPVAEYWPEFANNGKAAITVRHILTHRGGFPDDTIFKAVSWETVVKMMEETTPVYPAGEMVAYHPLNYGWVLGEVVRRVSDKPIERFMHDELFAPLQMHDSFLGLPETQDFRSMRWHTPNDEPGMGRLNSEASRRMPMPAATGWTTSSDMTRFYQMMLNGGELDGVRVVKPETVKQALAVSAMDQYDQTLKVKIRWGHGFSLGGGKYNSYGPQSTIQTFGHNGYQSTTAWADQERGLACAFFTNQVIGEELSFRRALQTNTMVMDICE